MLQKNNQHFKVRKINSWNNLEVVHPMVKFFCFIILLIAIFLPTGFFFQLILFTFTSIIWMINGLSARRFGKITLSVLIIFGIFLFFNWLIYKEPIAFNWSNHLTIGNQWWLRSSSQSYLQWSNEKTYLSKIWGGISPVVFQGETLTFNHHTVTISEIIKENWVTKHQLLRAWKGFNHQQQNALIAHFNHSKEIAQEYAWLIKNNWTFGKIKLQGSFVNQPNFLTPGQGFAYATTWYSLSPLAVEITLFMTIRVYLLILITGIMLETTSITDLSFAIAKWLTPLRWIKIPVNEIAIVIAMALNFIPLLRDETKQIIRAQANRGLDFQSRNFIVKLKSLKAIVTPLFVSALTIAEELALVMEARGYCPSNPMTIYPAPKWNWTFVWYSLWALGMLAVAISFTVTSLLFTPFGVFEAICITK